MARTKQAHTNFPVHTKVRIVLHDGRIIIDKFVEKKGKLVIFRENTFKSGDIKSATIWRNQLHSM